MALMWLFSGFSHESITIITFGLCIRSGLSIKYDENADLGKNMSRWICGEGHCMTHCWYPRWCASLWSDRRGVLVSSTLLPMVVMLWWLGHWLYATINQPGRGLRRWLSTRWLVLMLGVQVHTLIMCLAHRSDRRWSSTTKTPGLLEWAGPETTLTFPAHSTGFHRVVSFKPDSLLNMCSAIRVRCTRGSIRSISLKKSFLQVVKGAIGKIFTDIPKISILFSSSKMCCYARISAVPYSQIWITRLELLSSSVYHMTGCVSALISRALALTTAANQVQGP